MCLYCLLVIERTELMLCNKLEMEVYLSYTGF